MSLMLIYFDRFSDRDLLMRYHWGLGVGHLHAHGPISNPSHIPDLPRDTDASDNLSEAPPDGDLHAADIADDNDNPEMVLDEHDFEGWDDVESDASEAGNGDSGEDSGDDYGGIYD